MAKLNLTQVNFVVDALETVATQTIDHIVAAMRDQWLPPKLTDSEILKAVCKQVSDDDAPPKVKHLGWLLEGRPFPIEKERLVARDRVYNEIAQLETQMTLVAENYIRETKGKLLFEDTWEPGEIPEYLMDDLVDELMDFVQTEDPDES